MSDNVPVARMVKLISSDGKEFEISRKAIKRAGTLELLIGDLKLDEAKGEQVIPTPEVNSETLEKVVEFCNKHVEDPILSRNEENGTTVISEWDQQFLDIDQDALYHLILAANYLDIKCLLKVACKTVANMVRGKSVNDMRRIYNIKNDYTKEEEEKVKKENAWCEIQDP